MRSPFSLAGAMLLPGYMGCTVLVGWLARRSQKRRDARDALTANRALPLPVVVLAYVAANCGALEVVGMGALAAQYGIRALHFYWIGAVPALTFLSLRMMPAYVRSGIRTLPEYLELRFGTEMRRVNAFALTALLPLLGGVSLYALARVLHAMLDVPYIWGAPAVTAVALSYVLLGGVRANIYNEVLQLVVVLAGVMPLAWRTLPWTRPVLASGGVWRGLPGVDRLAPLDSLGLTVGLGFVLAFSYWCTDFVLMQRALTSRSESAARQVPLWAGACKMLLGFVFVLPGLAAARIFGGLAAARSFDEALPLTMRHLYGPTMLGLGLTALAASLLSGLAANITAAATVFSEDLYRVWLRPRQTARHYAVAARWIMVAAAAVSLFASFSTFLFGSLLEYVQALFSVVSAPFFAVFALGVVWRRATSRGALAGFCSGAAAGLLHAIAAATGELRYGSSLSASFYGAMLSFAVSAAACVLVSEARRDDSGPTTTRCSPSDADREERFQEGGALLLVAALLLLLCLLLNLRFA